jgi:hypothetical protein
MPTTNVSGAPVDLAVLADTIRSHHQFVMAAINKGLDHAIAAGEGLNVAHEIVPHGKWTTYVHSCDLNERTARRYMQLAKARSMIEGNRSRATELSIAGALRLIGGNSKGKTKIDRTASSSPPLSKAAWAKASIEDRRRFLEAIGANSLCEALSFALRAELRRRIAGQQTATTSSLAETIAKALRQALSLQKANNTSMDTPAAGVAAALDAVNNKLAGANLDLNNLVVVLDVMATQKKAA